MWSIQASWSGAMSVIGDLPLFLPAAGVGLVLAGMLATGVGRVLRTPRWSAFLLLACLAVILTATLTPSVAAFMLVVRPAGCILGQLDTPPLSLLLYPNETSLNVVLFVPLGIACGLLRRWSGVAVASVLAAGLPFGVEFIQYSVASLGRVCSTADVGANLTGLAVGLVASIVLVRPISSMTSVDAVAHGPR